MPKPATEMMTTKEVASFLGVSCETVRNRTVNRVRAGKPTKMAYEQDPDSRVIRFHRADVLAYREACRVAAVVPATVPDDGHEEAE